LNVEEILDVRNELCAVQLKRLIVTKSSLHEAEEKGKKEFTP